MRTLPGIIFFICCFYASSAQTTIYHQFPDSNATWTSYYFAGMWPIHTEYYTYTLAGDTVIGAFTYRKINISYVDTYGDTSSWLTLQTSGYQGCIREDTILKKVFYIEPGTANERTLYDFNLQVGDVYTGYMRHFISVFDTVQTIDSVLIGSDYRKRWIVGKVNEPFFGFFIIEGMGYGGGLLETSAGWMPDGPRLELKCFQENGITMYLYNAVSCEIIDEVNKTNRASQSEIALYPNPVQNQFTVDSKSAERRIRPGGQFTIDLIEIYNSLGEMCYSSAVNSSSCPPSPDGFGGQSIVNCESFPPGIYFVKAISGDKIFYKKFIKE